MFPLGAKVRLISVTSSAIPAAIVTALKGKIGTVVANNSHNWDYVVKFDSSPRPDGLYGFFAEDLELSP